MNIILRLIIIINIINIYIFIIKYIFIISILYNLKKWIYKFENINIVKL